MSTQADLSTLVAATDAAGWRRPLTVVPSRYMGGAFDLQEADGTRVAIIGCRPDADLILAALNDVLDRYEVRS